MPTPDTTPQHTQEPKGSFFYDEYAVRYQDVPGSRYRASLHQFLTRYEGLIPAIEPVHLGKFTFDTSAAFGECTLNFTPRNPSDDYSTNPNPNRGINDPNYALAPTLHLLTHSDDVLYRDDIAFFPASIKHGAAMQTARAPQPSDPKNYRHIPPANWLLFKPDITRTLDILETLHVCLESMNSELRISAYWLSRRRAAEQLASLLSGNQWKQKPPSQQLLEGLGRQVAAGLPQAYIRLLPAVEHSRARELPAVSQPNEPPKANHTDATIRVRKPRHLHIVPEVEPVYSA